MFLRQENIESWEVDPNEKRKQQDTKEGRAQFPPSAPQAHGGSGGAPPGSLSRKGPVSLFLLAVSSRCFFSLLLLAASSRCFFSLFLLDRCSLIRSQLYGHFATSFFYCWKALFLLFIAHNVSNVSRTNTNNENLSNVNRKIEREPTTSINDNPFQHNCKSSIFQGFHSKNQISSPPFDPKQHYIRALPSRSASPIRT